MGFFAVILLGLLIWFSETDLGKFMSYIGAVIIGLAIIISLIQFIFQNFYFVGIISILVSFFGFVGIIFQGRITLAC